MKNKRILISGAGIAGLTLAYWLKQAGFTPALIEKYPALRTEGYKLDIRGTALDVIQKMGVYPSVFESRTRIRESIFVDQKGRQITQTDPDLCGARVEGDLEIVRGDLCEILFDRIGNTECLFGDSIVNLLDQEDGVRVDFKNNPSRMFDLVVKADGLHSKVRLLSFGDESQFLRKLGLYVSFYSIPNFMNLDCTEIEFHRPRQFAIAYCPQKGDAKAGFAFSSNPPADLDLRDPVQQKQFLQNAFRDAGWEIPRILSFMKESPDFYFDCMAQVQMPRWTKGRIALVGDAGYAVSPVAGQGTSVALIGAYVLADELKKAQGDYIAAFERYEMRLKEYVRKNQELAKMSTALMEGDGASWLTSLSLFLGRHLPTSLIRLFKKWGQRQTAKAARAIAL